MTISSKTLHRGYIAASMDVPLEHDHQPPANSTAVTVDAAGEPVEGPALSADVALLSNEDALRELMG